MLDIIMSSVVKSSLDLFFLPQHVNHYIFSTFKKKQNYLKIHIKEFVNTVREIS